MDFGQRKKERRNFFYNGLFNSKDEEKQLNRNQHQLHASFESRS